MSLERVNTTTKMFHTIESNKMLNNILDILFKSFRLYIDMEYYISTCIHIEG